jgi:hypothetical protein
MAVTATQILANAAALGLAVAPTRAQSLAEEVARMLAALDRAAPLLCFESEPADFARIQRATAR